jgi:hypothetical protein
VNASFWLLDLPVPDQADVSYLREYSPTMFGFGNYQPGLTVQDIK